MAKTQLQQSISNKLTFKTDDVMKFLKALFAFLTITLCLSIVSYSIGFPAGVTTIWVSSNPPGLMEGQVTLIIFGIPITYTIESSEAAYFSLALQAFLVDLLFSAIMGLVIVITFQVWEKRRDISKE